MGGGPAKKPAAPGDVASVSAAAPRFIPGEDTVGGCDDVVAVADKLSALGCTDVKPEAKSQDSASAGMPLEYFETLQRSSSVRAGYLSPRGDGEESSVGTRPEDTEDYKTARACIERFLLSLLKVLPLDDPAIDSAKNLHLFTIGFPKLSRRQKLLAICIFINREDTSKIGNEIETQYPELYKKLEKKPKSRFSAEIFYQAAGFLNFYMLHGTPDDKQLVALARECLKFWYKAEELYQKDLVQEFLVFQSSFHNNIFVLLLSGSEEEKRAGYSNIRDFLKILLKRFVANVSREGIAPVAREIEGAKPINMIRIIAGKQSTILGAFLGFNNDRLLASVQAQLAQVPVVT